MATTPTLVKPRPLDPSKSAIENVLELTELTSIGPDLYTNARPLWQPPGARGIYGGAVIAQSLSAAQLTIPEHFTVHSMHCYFVLAGDSTIPITYHVERVREGRSFATRTVQARQNGSPIFTTTMSFVRHNSVGKRLIEHTTPMPKEAEGTKPEKAWGDVLGGDTEEEWSPFVAKRLGIVNEGSEHVHEKRTRQWMRAKGRISPAGGHQAHLSALAYMSDSYFIGTVSRLHGVSRIAKYARAQARGSDANPKAELGMIVSLDHTIFFHDPRAFRADEWMLTECETPWAGDGRGLVVQKMWGADGRLVATCFQEGVVRLKPTKEEMEEKEKEKQKEAGAAVQSKL